MAEILLIYSTTDGHTRKICERLKRVIETQDHTVSLIAIDQAPIIDLHRFEKIVIGASIRYGKHSRAVYKFIRQNQEVLESRPNAFFSVNVVARKLEKNRPETNPYLQKFLRQIAWRPKELAVFAGKIDYPRYRLWDRLIIQMIMRMTKGPTDTQGTYEFTDWQRVDEFGMLVARMG